MSWLKINVLILLAYFLIAVFFTFPLITGFNRYLFGYPGDSLSGVWFFWWVKHYNPDFLFLKTSLLNYPFGFNIGNIFFGPLIPALISIVNAKIFNEIFAANIFVFMGFVLAPYFTFLVVNKLTGNKYGSFLAGIIFGFSQYHLWQAFIHPDLASIQYLPPFFYFALVLIEKFELGEFSKKYLFLLVLAFGLIFQTSFYYAYFSLILYSLMISISLVKNRLRNILYYFVPFVFFAIPTLPVVIGLVKSLTGSNFAYSTVLIPKRTLTELSAYGARPWDYLAPSIYHPVFGQAVRGFYDYLRSHWSYQYWSPFLPERMNYLTISGLVLSVLAIVRYFKRGCCNELEKKRTLVLLAMIIFMFLLSLPAETTIHGYKLYFPSYLFFSILPMFRVYSRAGVFVLLAVATLAGFGWKYIYDRFGLARFVWRRILLFSLVVLIIIFENVSFPPFPIMDSSVIPQTYQWLRNEPGEFAIAEYPRDNSGNDLGGGCTDGVNSSVVRDYNSAYEVFYQRIHGKSILGYNTLSESERILLANLEDRQSYEILKKYKVSYIVIHTKDPMIGIHPWPYPQENPLDACWQRRIMKVPEKVYEGFKLVAEFDDGVVYRVQ